MKALGARVLFVLLLLSAPLVGRDENLKTIKFQFVPPDVTGVKIFREGVPRTGGPLNESDPKDGILEIIVNEKRDEQNFIFDVTADGYGLIKVRKPDNEGAYWQANFERVYARSQGNEYSPWLVGAALLTITFAACTVIYLLKKRPTVDPAEKSRSASPEEDKIGKYTLKKKLGQGGMAEVHLAEAEGRLYALKVVYPHIAAGKDFKVRFNREVSMGTRLIHPHIITVYEADEVDNKYFLALEYVEGSELRSLIPENGFDFEQAQTYLVPIFAAVDFAHGKGVIHRDIKPDNILVKEDQTPKLSDFGLARAHDFSTVTATGAAMGTPAYMSPEQIQGKSVSEASDQYSLGVMAFELFTGQLPFQEDEPLALIMKHLTQPPPSPSSLRPDLPENLNPVIEKMMAKDPGDRYPTVRDALEALKQVTG